MDLTNNPAVASEVLDATTVLTEEQNYLGLQTPGAASALCLSGGGIRSAAFCLGVVQAFAARGMLSQFHYLSSVSGGGYIAGWLTRCIAAYDGKVKEVENRLNSYLPLAAAGALQRRDRDEPAEISQLRRYVNFLTPNPGFASTDTWAGVVLWLRNTLINWMVFAPLFLAAAAVPVVYESFYLALGRSPHHNWCAAWPALSSTPCAPFQPADFPALWPAVWFVLLGAAGLACAFYATFNVCVRLPSHSPRLDPADPLCPHPELDPSKNWQPQTIRNKIVLPALAWIYLAPLALAPMLTQLHPQPLRLVLFHNPDPAAPAPAVIIHHTTGQAEQIILSPPVPSAPPKLALPDAPTQWCLAALLLPVCYILVCLLAFRRAAAAVPNTEDNKTAFVENFPAWLGSVLIGAFMLCGGLKLATLSTPFWTALCAPLWITLLESVRIIFYVAFRRHGVFSDLDREWLARLSGYKIRTVTAISVLSFAAVALPVIVIDRFNQFYISLAGAIAFLAGPAAAFLGKLELTPFTYGSATDEKKSKLSLLNINSIIAGAAIVFGLALVMLFGRLTTLSATEVFSNEPRNWTVAAMLLINFGLIASGLPGLLRFAKRTITSGKTLAARLIFALLLAIAIVVVAATAAFNIFCCPPLFDPHRGFFNAHNADATGFLIAAAGALEIAAASLALAYLIDREVNLNRFSMHAVYRNRLVRAFLGSARDHGKIDRPHHEPYRRDDPYTHFAPRDNYRLANSRAAAGQLPNRLFPVINVTLNRTSGSGTARAQRKAESFTISPLHCGAPALKHGDGAYVPTESYASGDEKDTGPNDPQNGITLGTAMALSGAAVSPNMGYNSSPFTAFLMTLFNVRLGAWLPNPANEPPVKELLMRSGPLHAIPSMLQELSGQSDDDGKYVYLSDGGHFDNLGLYEMLRRRCGLIVVVDAGRDANYQYADLGHVLQSALIDFGTQVEFVTPAVSGHADLAAGFLYAKVTYPPLPGQPSSPPAQLIYIKPYMPKNAPVELVAYSAAHGDFPNKATTDQFFTESDFESYRRLGELVTNNMLNNARNLHPPITPPPNYQLQSFFRHAAHYASTIPT